MSTPERTLNELFKAALCFLIPGYEGSRLSVMFATRLLLASRGLSLLLLLSLLVHPNAYAASQLDAMSAKKMVIARGVGHSIKVHEGQKVVLRGRIVSLGEDAFLLQRGSKPAVSVPYNEITQVQTPGVPTATKIGIGVGIGVVIGVAAVIIHTNSRSWYSR